MVPEDEFTCDYLTNIGITAKGLQMKLINLHKELRIGIESRFLRC